MAMMASVEYQISLVDILIRERCDQIDGNLTRTKISHGAKEAVYAEALTAYPT